MAIVTATPEQSFSVTAREAAAQLGVHVETVKRWCRDGKLPARKGFTGIWLLAQRDLDQLPVHELRQDVRTRSGRAS